MVIVQRYVAQLFHLVNILRIYVPKGAGPNGIIFYL